MAEEEQILWHKVTTNIVCNKLSGHTKYACRHILKYVKLHRDRSVSELCERSIYERYSIYKMIMSEFFIGKYAIAISTELSYVIRKKDVCEFHHVFRRDCESNQARTDRVERLDYLFVMPECTFHVYSSHVRIQCIVMSMCQSMNIDQSYITGVNKFLKVEHSGLVSK